MALLLEIRELGRCDQLPFDHQFKPVRCFLKLSQRVTAFGDKFGFAPPAVCLAVVGSNRCS